jgi:hypothetical protein
MRTEELHGSAGPTASTEPSRNCTVIPQRGLALSGVALALAASSLLSVTPAQADVIAGVPGQTYTGDVGLGDSDEYDFGGLTPGNPFTLVVTDLGGGIGVLLLNLYHDAISVPNQIGSQVTLCCQGSQPPFNPHTFNGFLPSSLLILTVGNNFACCEGYSVRLTTASATPEPATLALMGAGLAGALIARRRKRG